DQHPLHPRRALVREPDPDPHAKGVDRRPPRFGGEVRRGAMTAGDGGSGRKRLLEQILGRIDLGVLVIDKDSNILVWNYFLEVHSGRSSAEVLGRNLYDCFPELPKTWLSRKL